MDILKLLADRNITHLTSGHPRCSNNHVNTHCPFCPGERDYHLGIQLQGEYANCWRCGWHPISKVIAQILGIPENDAKKILSEYGRRPYRATKEIKRTPRAKAHRYPSGTDLLTPRHLKYLEKRGFDPERITSEWDLLGTGAISKLDNTDYRFRIIAPILWDNKQVSFQARDITDRHPMKYLACPKDRELIEHKHILYGNQTKWQDVGVCVEGITDVWRLGPRSFATLGIKFTDLQVRQIAKYFRRVIILYDSEPQAQEQAKLLEARLLVRNVEAVIETVAEDPGALTDKEAKNFLRKIY